MATTVWTPTTALTLGNDDFDFSYRARVGLNAGGQLSASLGQVRVRFPCPTNSGDSLKFTHVSIGIAKNAVSGGGTDADFETVATPTELLFSGGSGFTIANNSVITSDWVNLSFAITDDLIVIMDIPAGGPGGTAFSGSQGTHERTWYKASVTTWNVAAPTGFTSLNIVTIDGPDLIETQAAAGDVLMPMICM